jgi:Tol biopolymer transport system component
VNAGTGISAPRRLTLDERQDYPFAWSPDNKSVLFDSDRDGTFHIFKQAVARATPELLAGGNEQLVTPRLTPDRRTVLYLVTPKFDQTTNQVRMMRVPLAGGPPQLVLKADGLNNHQCSVLPANVCIFSSIQEGEIRFFRFDPLTGESNELPQLKRRETDYYSFNWSLSPDGTTLATSRKSMPNSDAAIRLISIADSSEILRPVPGWPFLNSLDWAADGESIWVSASTTQDGSSLLNVPLNGRVRTIIDDQKMRVGWAIQSTDGKKLAIWQASGTSNVWMLENF